MGVIIPLELLGILALLPFALDRSADGEGVWFNRAGRIVQAVALLVIVFVLFLTARGALR
jgi:hypothetical protein